MPSDDEVAAAYYLGLKSQMKTPPRLEEIKMQLQAKLKALSGYLLVCATLDREDVAVRFVYRSFCKIHMGHRFPIEFR